MYVPFTINSKCITSLIPRSCFIRHSKKMPMNIYGINNLDNDPPSPLTIGTPKLGGRGLSQTGGGKRKFGFVGWPTGGARKKHHFLEHRPCDGIEHHHSDVYIYTN